MFIFIIVIWFIIFSFAFILLTLLILKSKFIRTFSKSKIANIIAGLILIALFLITYSNLISYTLILNTLILLGIPLSIIIWIFSPIVRFVLLAFIVAQFIRLVIIF